LVQLLLAQVYDFLSPGARSTGAGTRDRDTAAAPVTPLLLPPLSACSDTAPTSQPKGAQAVNTITSKDGTQIYYKDWGRGPVVTFSHGWPLNADAWDGQMLFLVQKGFRVVAHDRRGHGRSGQASSGNDMNGYADDLAAVIETLDLKDVTLVGPFDWRR
jgi:hypothetical protein